LFSGCWAVRLTPAVCVWKRSSHERGFEGAEGFFHLAGPDAAGGAVLGDLLEKVIVRVEEEGQPRGEEVHVHAAVDAPAHVFQPVSEREGQLLGGGGARLADVIAADRDRVPLRDGRRTVFHRVHHQPHGGLGREDEFLLGDELFQDVVLDGAAQLVGTHALFLGGGDVHGPDDGRRRVDGHAGGHLLERDAVHQDLHVLQGRNRHAAFAELSQGFGLVGIVAHQGGQVESDRQAGLSLVEQVFEAGVGLFGGTEAGEHAHGPQLAAVHGGMHAARVGIFARVPQVSFVIQVFNV